ncbi:hypothetical protein CBFG_00022 [Clostridiales bacterium 1_7_47FAA]|nr:hypothetical protein CBFG_00022 [Clostridiales bacterium 1_7_47FAA]
MSGMGMGGMDAGCGASSSKPSGTGAGQEAGAQTRALAFPMILISGSDKGRRPLSTASRRLRPARPCRCIHPSHPHSTHPLRFPNCSTS